MVPQNLTRWMHRVAALVLAVLLPGLSAGDEPTTFDPYPLRPADTSSPRDTLRSFDEGVIRGDAAFKVGEPAHVIVKSTRVAAETMDFSRFPERGRFESELESILLLKAILDRIELPSEEDIPGDREVGDAEGAMASWTIPDTRITIARVDEGVRAGEFLFTAETIEQLEEFYERARHLPYKPRALTGMYEGYLHRAGLMVPPSWTAALPRWSKATVFGNSLWKLIGLLVVLAIAVFLVRGLLRAGRRWDETQRDSGALMRFGLPIAVAAGIGVVYACGYAATSVLRLHGNLGAFASVVAWTLVFAGVGWLIVLAADRLSTVINDARRIKESSIDGQLVKVCIRLATLTVLVFLVIYAADFFGVPLTPVLAGLGIGGLAIALAVRPTLENIIGGLVLFVDKPVKIGNYCRFGNDYGTVEEIGLRSTRLRKLDDTVVSLPNSDFSQRELTNYASRRRWLYQATLGLRYETSTEQLRYVMAKLREMLIGHPKVSPDWLHVRFAGFGAYSFDINVFAYIRTREWLSYRAIREDINLRIVDIVKEAGTSFAFPSQTAYLGRDPGLDTEYASEAERRVQEWRADGQLPFPEFDGDIREGLEDVLDYPPEGSPDHAPRAGSERSPAPRGSPTGGPGRGNRGPDAGPD